MGRGCGLPVQIARAELTRIEEWGQRRNHFAPGADREVTATTESQIAAQGQSVELLERAVAVLEADHAAHARSAGSARRVHERWAEHLGLAVEVF